MYPFKGHAFKKIPIVGKVIELLDRKRKFLFGNKIS